MLNNAVLLAKEKNLPKDLLGKEYSISRGEFPETNELENLWKQLYLS